MSQTIKQPPIQEKPLRQNPFTAYRDPQTGRWMVIKSSSSR